MDVYIVANINKKDESLSRIVLVIWKLLKFHHVRPKEMKKCIYGHFRLSEGCTYIKTPIVNQVFLVIAVFAVILKGQPTFYNQRFGRYEFWLILGLLGPILAQ